MKSDIVHIFEDKQSQYINNEWRHSVFCFIYPGIPEEKKQDARNNFSISTEEEILWIRDKASWTSVGYGTVITDNGIYKLDKQGNKEFIGWKSIQSVFYFDDTLYFDKDKEALPRFLLVDDLIREIDKQKRLIAGEQISTLFNEMLKAINHRESVSELLIDRFSDDDISPDNTKAIEEYINYLKEGIALEKNSGIRVMLQDILSLMYWWKGDTIGAIEYIGKVIDENPTKTSKLLHTYYLSQIEIEPISYYYNLLQQWSETYDAKGYLLSNVEYNNALELCKKSYVDKFLSIPPQERRFIVFSESFDTYPKEFYVLPFNMIPKDLLIDGDPEVNELYIKHPYKPNKYFLAKDYALGIFRDKLSEFKHIMVRLGAKEINLIDTQELHSTQRKDKNIGGKVEGGVPGISGSVGLDYQDLEEKQLKVKNEIIQSGRYNLVPSKYPAVPNNVVWYPHEDEWQTEVESRLEGYTLDYIFSITLNKSSITSKSTQLKIEAGMKSLMGDADFELHFDKNVFNSLDSLHSMTFKVEFYPLSEYRQK